MLFGEAECFPEGNIHGKGNLDRLIGFDAQTDTPGTGILRECYVSDGRNMKSFDRHFFLTLVMHKKRKSLWKIQDNLLNLFCSIRKTDKTFTVNIKELYDLKGKVALVTGGARHLGFDAACALAEAGCDLIITSRKLENAVQSAEKLHNLHGGDVLPLSLDVCVYDQVAQVFKAAGQWKGHLDIVVNNAGGNVGISPANLFERDPDDMAQMIMTNLTGALYCCREAGGIMAKQGYGKIINIASIAGMVGRDRRMYMRSNLKGQPVDYAAAKAGVIGMTRDLAGFLSPMGVYVNAISPGGFGPRELPPGFHKDYCDRTPLGRMGTDGKDLKGAILFLASVASDYITGHNLVIDGGFTIWK